MRILIVDRSALICERLATMLCSRNDVEVVAIYDVGMIYESINKFSPDVLIIDTDMVGAGGMGLVRNLKKHNTSPILIMLTNHSISQYRRRYLDAGADFHFDKAYEFNKIPDVVNCMRLQRAG